MSNACIIKRDSPKLERSDDVRSSRAGDAFHYRWAARRCLKLLYPDSKLEQIIIEGSKDQDKKGECVIDIAEYYAQDNNLERIEYFQLKHTTKRKTTPFTMSELKKTIVGFANRYSEHFIKSQNQSNNLSVKFSIVTNRPINKELKKVVKTLACNSKMKSDSNINLRLYDSLIRYTGLSKKNLQVFCSMLELLDSEGDFEDQSYELQKELSEVLTTNIETPLLDTIIALVNKKALPGSDRVIVREELLIKCFGVTSENLFPAPAKLVSVAEILKRKQYEELKKFVNEAPSCKIVHAAGGVGKSIAAQYVANTIPEGSVAVIYDCFGGGNYRRRSEFRHRYKDALIQIANELSLKGLCDPLIPINNAQDEDILRKFLHRITITLKSLRQKNKQATLTLLIDAADNAEIFAKEVEDKCFVHEILRESFPDGCKVVCFCRTERRNWLQPASTIPQFELSPFDEEESLQHIQRYFSLATIHDGLEFRRFTNGNPRVQANALNMGYKSITDVLESLGPNVITVDEQIEVQLNNSISKIKDNNLTEFTNKTEAICTGLAVLPPLIPLKVLSAIAQVDESEIKSFVVDLGRGLLILESNLQFLDEPTETWFKKKFLTRPEQIIGFLNRLKPLAQDYTYVAETIPSLLLLAEKLDELIELALSDKFLPKKNPIDERNVRVFRLKFAFRAALKLKRYKDVIKLALRAGEEVAGDKRQNDFLSQNVDLIAPLLSEQKVRELSFKKLLGKSWIGSGNIYSSSLLSTVKDYHGEARGYLRAANSCLKLYFEERKKDEDYRQQDSLSEEDIAELTFAYFNLYGAAAAVKFILSWKPPEIACKVGQIFIKRFVDAGNFNAINEILKIKFSNPYLIIAITNELIEVGQFPSVKKLEKCLHLLTQKKTRVSKPSYNYNDTTAIKIISFLEACVAKNLPKNKILKVLLFYFQQQSTRSIKDEYPRVERDAFLRSTALRCILSGQSKPEIDDLLSEELKDEKLKHDKEQERRELTEVIGSLLPWYLLRAKLIVGNINDLERDFLTTLKKSKEAQTHRYKEFDFIKAEIPWMMFEILKFYSLKEGALTQKIFDEWVKQNNQMKVNDRLRALRIAYKLDIPITIKNDLEQSTREIVNSLRSERPETVAELFIDLARAVLQHSKEDASVYFNSAIEIMSKFGDEIVQRWEAVVELAKRSTEGDSESMERAYRYFRCAELVGENVAREKYWNRDDAMRTCVRLSPTSALAGISRWRDRDIGWFEDHVSVLAEELIMRNKISSTVGWPLSVFIKHEDIGEFAAVCIENESSNNGRQDILDKAIEDLRLSDTVAKPLERLKYLSEKYGLDKKDLDDVISFYLEELKVKNENDNNSIAHATYSNEKEKINWFDIFENIELNTNIGINKALKRFSSLPPGYNPKYEFWKEVLNRIHDEEVLSFLKELIYVDNIALYDVREVLSSMPKVWREKISVKNYWAEFIELIAKKFAYDFTNKYTLNNFLENIGESDIAIPFIRNGILSGLEHEQDTIDANLFFGFVEMAASLISPHEATELLDFALDRFELHIEDEFGDGKWEEWLIPPEQISDALAGFVWSALGSPRSEIRWRAAHCVRRLAETNCNNEIASLLAWIEKDQSGAFSHNKFPFYNLHARLYLLIALARVSEDNTGLLKKYSQIFVFHALHSISHILLQKYSAQIALRIEKDFPDTYEKEIVKQLKGIGVSKFPIKEIDRGYERNILGGGIYDGNRQESRLYHSYDFDRYWFEPLGEVFGVSAKKIENLATDIILDDWNIEKDGSFINDPRQNLWRSHRYDRGTHHSHGSYPTTDDYGFYLSYHSMFIIAGRLINEMPVVHIEGDWREDEWDKWLSYHKLTRCDGRWLSDRRDPLPLERKEWMYNKDSDNWISEISDIDFIDALFNEKNKKWLNIEGDWETGDNSRTENYSISSALVSPKTSQSLLNALSSSSNPHNFQLPYCNEDDTEYDLAPFKLMGWIWRNSSEKGIDNFDPFSGEISFPPYQIGKTIIRKLELTADSEIRNWYMKREDECSLKCEIWSSEKKGYEGERLHSGIRLTASLEFLKRLCKRFNNELVLEVKIDRRMKHTYNKSSISRSEYKPPHFKIFVLSADGEIKDERRNYKLG